MLTMIILYLFIHDLQVMFSEEDLPRDPGEYILGYYSNNTNSIVGVTEPFQVHSALTQLHSDSYQMLILVFVCMRSSVALSVL